MYNYNHTVRDVLYFLDTGIIEHRNTTNTLAMEQFIEELDLQEQIDETEIDTAIDRQFDIIQSCIV